MGVVGDFLSDVSPIIGSNFGLAGHLAGALGSHLFKQIPFKKGGKVKYLKGMPHTAYSKTHDTIPAILQVGEYVVTKKQAKSKQFNNYLKNKK